MTIIFWLSLVVLMYTYFGYPAHMFLVSRILPGRVGKDLNYKPFVSVVFSAHNEEACIGKKIINLLSSNYPKEKLEILVGSDGSTDRTDEILSGMADERVKIFKFAERRGKINVLNELVPKARGEIVVFCDTRQMFDQDAIANLSADFKDQNIGCVSGELIFTLGADDTKVSRGVDVYWQYEKFIRVCESAVHSMVGATGAIYAVRKELYSPPPANTILDDVYIPLAIARQGYRCIVDGAARAYDRPSRLPEEEYRRKVRTLAGNYQIFVMFKGLFIPLKNDIAMPLFSHKFLRVAAPLLMIAAFVSNIFIARDAALYTASMILQVLFYGMAAIGLSVPYMFCQMNFAALAGLYRFMFNKQKIAWEK